MISKETIRENLKVEVTPAQTICGFTVTHTFGIQVNNTVDGAQIVTATDRSELLHYLNRSSVDAVFRKMYDDLQRTLSMATSRIRCLEGKSGYEQEVIREVTRELCKLMGELDGNM